MKAVSNKTRLGKLSRLPAPPEGMQLLEIKDIVTPHPYCITPKHMQTGSMYLDEATIRESEEKFGAVCDICKKRVKAGAQSGILPFDEHKKQSVLFMEVPKGNLNEIAGLKDYLLKVKPLLAGMKIDGIAFKQV